MKEGSRKLSLAVFLVIVIGFWSFICVKNSRNLQLFVKYKSTKSNDRLMVIVVESIALNE